MTKDEVYARTEMDLLATVWADVVNDIHLNIVDGYGLMYHLGTLRGIQFTTRSAYNERLAIRLAELIRGCFDELHRQAHPRH